LNSCGKISCKKDIKMIRMTAMDDEGIELLMHGLNELQELRSLDLGFEE